MRVSEFRVGWFGGLVFSAAGALTYDLPLPLGVRAALVYIPLRFFAEYLSLKRAKGTVRRLEETSMGDINE